MLFGNFNLKLFLFLFFFGSFTKGLSQDSLTYYNKQLQQKFQQKNKAESQKIFQKKLKYLQQKNNLEEYTYAFFDFFMLQPIKSRTPILKKGIENKWRTPKSNDEHIAKLHVIINIAYHFKKFGNINIANLWYEKAMAYYQQNNVSQYDIESYCLRPLANNYTRLGDYENAIDILKTTIGIAQKKKQNNVLISALTNLAIAYNATGNLLESQAVLNQALLVSNINSVQKERVLSQIAKNYFDLKKYKKAITIAKQADKLNSDSEIKHVIYKTIGIARLKLKQYKKAEINLNKALSAAQNTFGKHDREVAKTFNLLANVAIEKRNYKNALNYYQKALQTLLPKFRPKTIYDVVHVDQLFAENSIKEALDGKASVFELINDQKNALKNYALAFKLDALLRNVYSSQSAKLILQQTNRSRSEKVIDILYGLYKKSKNDSLAGLALEYAELSKSVILKERFKEQNTLIKDSLFTKRQYLVKEKSKLSTAITLEELKNEEANVNHLKNLIEQKSKIGIELQLIEHRIDDKYPILKKSKKIQSKTLVESVPKHGLGVEYFEGSQAFYVFSIAKNKPISFRKIVKTKNFIKLLNTYFSFYANNYGMQIKNDFKKFQDISFKMYQTLLASEVKDSNTQTLLLITDGLTSFIPFDALLTSKSNTTNFQKLPYLIKSKQITYTYSLSILQENTSRKKAVYASAFGGFFPVFENNARNLSTLHYTLTEAKQLKEAIKGSYYLKEKALKSTFLKQKNTKIIHLSTHASAGNFKTPAYIEFRNNTLYLSEIYGLALSCKLMVLSACETGIGKLQKGEGVMSLARGFSYTGIQNLVVSLWKVNDKSTSTLMTRFYKELAAHKTISKALHNAKLAYLEDSNIQNSKKTPYYWASFIHISNVLEAQNEKNYTYLYLLLALTIIGLSTYFVKNKA